MTVNKKDMSELEGIENLGQGLFVEIHKCIYCGSHGPSLTDEHGIPFGLLPLNAPGLVLRSASCTSCSGITSAFERSVLQRLWRPARSGLGLRSYRKRNREKKYPLTIVRDGEAEEILLPLEEYPATMQFTEYPPPACFQGGVHKNGVLLNALRLIQVAGPPLQELASRLGVKSFQFNGVFEGVTYERLLLKIAYCFSVAFLGLGSFERVYILPALMGERQDIGTWLGCDGESHLDARGFHGCLVSISGRDVVCRIRLFSKFPSPEYVVVVGKVSEGFVKGGIPESSLKYF